MKSINEVYLELQKSHNNINGEINAIENLLEHLDEPDQTKLLIAASHMEAAKYIIQHMKFERLS